MEWDLWPSPAGDNLVEAPGLYQHAEIARHDKVPGRGHLHDHHHVRAMSNKRNHGDESNRVPYIGQAGKLPCNKRDPEGPL